MSNPKTIQKRSGPQNSGEWDGWSPWYRLCSDELPPGYRIESHEFHLEGDRQCGAWAECGQTESGTDRVCYEFRMQGHNENRALLGIGNPNSGVRQSEGVLTVVIRND